MDRLITEPGSYESIADTLRASSPGDTVCCNSEASFTLAKVVMVKERLTGVTVQLLDQDGYAIKQVSSKKRGTESRDALTDRQMKVVKALEKVLMHCKKEGIQLIGYSDELVALPASLPPESISTAAALDVCSFGVYHGADAFIDLDDA